MFSTSVLSCILNTITVCEPATAQKIGLDHIVWFWVAQCAVGFTSNIKLRFFH